MCTGREGRRTEEQDKGHREGLKTVCKHKLHS
jgi:hypothetical protein